MRRLTQKIWDLLFTRGHQTAQRRPAGRRLTLESLEDRAVPTSTVISGTITGVAFVDHNQNHVRDAGEFLLPGVQVNLSGTTSLQGKSVNVSATTDALGAFTFSDVQPGTYKIGYENTNLLVPEPTADNSLSGPPGVTVVAEATIVAGNTVTTNVAFAGLSAQGVSLAQFSSDAGNPVVNLLPPGSGTAFASSRADSPPTVVSTATSTFSNEAEGGSRAVDLAGYFTDPDITNSTIQFNTSAGAIKVQLFDTQAPQTVANFFDYITAGDYNNSIFHRLVSGFVLQGGGFTLSSGATPQINTIPTLPAVPNEHLAIPTPNSNTAGTLAMALPGTNANGATDEFFFNLANNASTLDTANANGGPFTVFGKIVGQTSTTTVSNPAITKLITSTATDESSTQPDFSQVPLNNGYAANDPNFPTDTTPSDFDLIKNVQILSRNEALTYKVLSNSNPNLVSTSLQDEHLTLNYAAGQTGTATITVEAIDEFGASVTTSLTVNVINQPVVTGVPITTDNTANTTKLTANPTSIDPFSGRTVTYSYQWLQNGTPISGQTSQTLSLTGLTNNIKTGDTISVQVTPNDGTTSGNLFTSTALKVATVSPDLTFSLPDVTSVSITPNSTTNTTTLTAKPSSDTDPYGKPITYTYQWLYKGSPVSGATGATLTLSSALPSGSTTFTVGDSFSVEVTPSDGVITGTQFTTQTATVATSSTTATTLNLPVVTAVSVAPDSATNVTKLTATPTGSDANYTGRTLTFTYQWQQNGTNISSSVASATTATLDLSQLTVHKGDTFTVIVTASDGTLSSAGFASSEVTLATVKPDTLNVPVVKSVAISLDVPTAPTTLTATPVSHDPSNGTVTYTYQWSQNGTAIPGATSASLSLSTVTSINANDLFTVTVTPHSGSVSGAAFTSQAAKVASINPVLFDLPTVTTLTVTPDRASGATTLTAKPTNTDTGYTGRTVTDTYQWFQNGSPITISGSGATTLTLNLSKLTIKAGDDFTVQVTPSDGTLTGASKTSGDVAATSSKPIVIGVPIVDSVSIAPDNPAAITMLTATPSSHDPSTTSTLTYTYHWLLNGKAIAGSVASATTATLDLTQLTLHTGDTLSVQVTPSDGTLAGSLFTSTAVTVTATTPAITISATPVVTSVAIAPDSLTSTTMLTVTPTGTDPFGTAAVTYTYQWLHDGKAIAGATAATLDLTNLTVRKGDSFSVRVTPHDGTQTGATFTSKALTVASTSPAIKLNLPTVTSVVISADNATSTSVLTATPTSTDPYGNAVTYTYQWQQNGTDITGQTGQILTLSAVSKINATDTFSVVVTPNDGLISGNPFTSHTVSIATTTPTITLNGPVVTAVHISEDSATATMKLTATPTSTDPYGETVTYSYQWLLNGNAITGQTSQSLTLNTVSSFNPGDSFSVKVTPADATVAGAVFTSQSATIATITPNDTLNLPAVTAVTVAPNSTTNTTTLTATPTANDASYTGRTLTFTYQWQQNGKNISSSVASATTATLDLTKLTLHKGDTFTVVVTPSDGTLSGTAFTSAKVSLATVTPDTTLNFPVVKSVAINLDSLTAPTTLTADPVGSDPYGRTITYTYQWFQGSTAIAGATSATLSLSTLTNTAAGDSFTVQVTPSDGSLSGAVFTSQAVIEATASPSITFDLPVVTGVTVTPNRTTAVTTLTAKPTSTDTGYTGRTVTYTYQWFQNGNAINGQTSQTLQLSKLTVSKGDEFTVQVKANDGTLTSASKTSGDVDVASVGPIVLGLPAVDSVNVTPNDVANVTTLTATPSGHDLSSTNTLTYTYQWLLNGKAIAGATSATLNLTMQVPNLKVGNTLSVQVAPSDGTLVGSVFTSNAVTVASINPITLSGPVITSVNIAPDSPTAATLLTATPSSTDLSGRTVTYTYQWLQDGKAISGASAATLDLTNLSIALGDSFSVRVTPHDGKVTGAIFTSRSLTVASTSPITFGVPVVTSVVITPDNAADTAVLTATPTSTDPYGDPVTYTYQWEHGGTPITGQTGQTLTLSAAGTITVGDNFSVVVTPNDGLISGSAFTSHTVSIATTSPNITLNGPVVTGVVISTNNTTNTTTLTATPTSTDPNGETVTYSYQWFQNGNMLSGKTSQSLDLTTLSAVNTGDSFTVQVTPTDATITGAVFTSTAVSIATASPNPITINLPTVTSVVITPNNATSTTVLTATPASNTDPYGKTITFAYQWLHNGTTISGQTSQTLALSAVGTITAGDTFSVIITPSDGVTIGAAFTSHTVSIATTSPNITLSGPVVTSVVISTDNATNTTTLTATPTSTDPNGETVTYTYQWLENTNPLAGQTNQSLNLTGLPLSPGESFSVQVTPVDATITGTLLTSSAVTVATVSPNPVTINLPAVTSVVITPDNATSTAVLTATPASNNDPYGKTITYTYQWLHGGTAITGQTGQTLTLSAAGTFSVGDSFSVVVTPSDGVAVGGAFTSTAVTVATVSPNPVTINLPTVTSVVITPNNAISTGVLTATPASNTDPYGKTITFAYQWLHNGTTISGQTSQTLALSAVGTITAGDTFSVIVTPSDGVTIGAAFTSHTVSIATTSPNITLSGPVVTSVLISTDNTTNTTKLTATPTSTDPNGETVTYSYQWFQNGKVLTGQNNQSLDLTTPSSISVNDTFTVEVTPADATIAGTTFTSSAATVATASPNPVTIELPAVASISITPNSATNATTLTAHASGTDPYTGRTVSYSYQWFQNGNELSGQTNQSLNLTALTSVNQNDVFTVQVTPNDGTVIGAADTSGNVEVTSVSPTIAIGLPVVDAVSITSDDPTNMNVTTLTAAPSSHDDSGNSNITYTYQWLLNGTTVLTGATTATLNLTTQVPGGVAVGNTLSVQVTPNDGTLAGNPFTSPTVTIATASPNPITLS